MTMTKLQRTSVFYIPGYQMGWAYDPFSVSRCASRSCRGPSDRMPIDGITGIMM